MLGQVFEITLMNLRNISARWGSSSVIIVGIAGVVAVLVGLLSMATGFNAALSSAARPDRAVIIRDGTNNELSSIMGIEAINIVARYEGIEVASPELYVVVGVPKKSSGVQANVIARAVQASAFAVRPELQIVAGRTFEPGRNEMIAGVKAVTEFAGLDIGNRVELRDSEWEVVGHFTDGGSATESEVWLDLALAQTTFRREGTANSIRVRLEVASLAAAIDQRLQDDPRLQLALVTEEQFFSEQSASRAAIINQFGYVVAAIMAVGAVFAALNTMYSAVSTRTVEIATLRALGFGNGPVVISVMIESLVLALFGGVLGGLLVYLYFDGYTASTLNNVSFSQVAFDFAVTWELLQLGLTWALLLGLVGGLFPAVRAARLPITTALRGE